MKIISKNRLKSFKRSFGYVFHWGGIDSDQQNDDLEYVLKYQRIPDEASVVIKDLDEHGTKQYKWTWYETIVDE